MVADSALALLLGGFGLSMPGFVTPWHAALLVTFTLGMVAPLVLRRRYPVGAFAAVIVVGGLEVLTLPHPIASDLSVIVLLYTLAAYRPRRLSVPGLAVCLLGCVLAIARWAPAHAITSGYALGAIAAVFCGPPLSAWLLGDLMHWRRGYYQALEERAARLERERDAHAQVAAAAERARIARELHDVVAHNVSVMVVQADGAGYALDTSPEAARQALEAIARTGRQALAEMRSLLGVLRSADYGSVGTGDDDGSGGGLAPQPGIEQLAGLLEQARAVGLPVSFTVEGVPVPLAAGPALAAYRIVQESLTNARKHGGPAVTAAVTLRFSENELMIKVADDGRGSSGAGSGSSWSSEFSSGVAGASGVAGPSGVAGASGVAGPSGAGEGLGLLGMRERVDTFGGTLVAGSRPGGGWRVIATLPLAPADSVLGAAS